MGVPAHRRVLDWMSFQFKQFYASIIVNYLSVIIICNCDCKSYSSGFATSVDDFIFLNEKRQNRISNSLLHSSPSFVMESASFTSVQAQSIFKRSE